MNLLPLRILIEPFEWFSLCSAFQTNSHTHTHIFTSIQTHTSKLVCYTAHVISFFETKVFFFILNANWKRIASNRQMLLLLLLQSVVASADFTSFFFWLLLHYLNSTQCLFILFSLFFFYRTLKFFNQVSFCVCCLFLFPTFLLFFFLRFIVTRLNDIYFVCWWGCKGSKWGECNFCNSFFFQLN